MDSMNDEPGNSDDAGAGASLPRYTAEVWALIEELKAAQTQDALSGKAFAERVGKASGTWTSFLGGTYSGRLEPLMEAGRAWLSSRRTGRRLASVLPREPAWVETPTGLAIIAALEHCQHAPDLGLITGQPGIGKTRAVEAYRQQAPNVWIVTGEPILRTAHHLLVAIAEEMEISGASGTQALSRAIVRRLRGSGGLLIVDEVQHFGTPALDQLRTIQDKARCGVAMVGNEEVHQRIEGTGRTLEFAQLFSRVGMRLSRLAASKEDAEALLDARQVTGAQQRKLLRAIASRPGALRLMSRVLSKSCQVAGGDPSPESIDAAYHMLSARPQDEKGARRG